MPKGGSGGKRTTSGGGALPEEGIQLNLRSMGFEEVEGELRSEGVPEGATVSQVHQFIMNGDTESVAIFGNDRRLLEIEGGEGGEVTLSGKSINKYRNDIRIMTHNHPIDLPLSTGDLIAASKLGFETNQNFEELSAVSKNGNVYRALRPKNGKWPTEQEIQKSIKKNIRPAYEKALQARRSGASKDDAFQIYQDTLTNKIAKDTGIRLKNGNKETPLSLFNTSDMPELRTPSGRPSALARQMYGTVVPGEKPGSFPIFDTQSANAAVQLRRFAKTEEGKADILARAKEYTQSNIDLYNYSPLKKMYPNTTLGVLHGLYDLGKLGTQKATDSIFPTRKKNQRIKFRNESEILRSINTGKPTAEARRQFGANLPGEKVGSFPIFDEQSAKSALKLRSRVHTKEGLERIYKEAGKYTPELAQQAKDKDRQKGISLHNESQQYRKLVDLENDAVLNNTTKPPKTSTLLGLAGGYYGMKAGAKAANVIPAKGKLRLVAAPLKFMATVSGMKKGYQVGKYLPQSGIDTYKSVKSGKINLDTIKQKANKEDLKKYGKTISRTVIPQGRGTDSSTAFYFKSGINPLSAFSESAERKAAFWATNPYTRKIPTIAGGLATSRLTWEVMKSTSPPLTALAGATIAGFAGKAIIEKLSHRGSLAMAKRYSTNPLNIYGDYSGYVAARTGLGGLRGGAIASRDILREQRQRRRS